MDECFSLLVSHILDNLGYSEEMRQYRTEKYSDENFVSSLCSHRIVNQGILAGSKAEGASAFDESDFDHLFVCSNVKATESEDIVEGDNDLTLFMESDTTPAGYCKLQLLQCGRNNWHHQKFLMHYCYVPCPGYCRPHLSSTFILHMEHVHMPPGGEISGPANKLPGVNLGRMEMDTVHSIRCSHIPYIFNNWFRKHQNRDWPTRQLMEQIATSDIFLVPAGKHGSETKFLEWRLSFNMAEKILIQNFSTVQYKVYILLKMVMKEVIQPQCPKSITSYMVKTLMLWAVEENPADSWKIERLVDILLHMLERVYRCVESGVCPMYFIPEDNILHGRINEETQIITCNILSTLLRDRSLCVLKVPSITTELFQYTYVDMPVRLHYYIQKTTEEKANILMDIVRRTHAQSLRITDRDMLLCRLQEGATIPYKDVLTDLVSVTITARSDMERLIKYLFNHTLSQLALQKCVDATTQVGSNVQKYRSVRQCANILQGTIHNDVLCGRVKLAQVLYMLGQYTAALDVLTDAADRVRDYMENISLRTDIKKHSADERLERPFGNETLSTSVVLKHFNLLDLQFDPDMEPCLPKALQYEVHRSQGSRHNVLTDSEISLYYQQYLCYTRTRQSLQADVAFTNLVRCAFGCGFNIEYREVALNVLGHCLLKKGLYDHAAKVLVKSVMLRKQYPHLDTYDALGLKKNAAYCHIAILLNKIYSRN